MRKDKFFKRYFIGRRMHFLTISLVVAINLSGQPNIVKAEYFFDTEPGFGNGTNIPVSAGTVITSASFSTNINSLSTGVHQLFVRAKDANGSWSISNRTFFYKYPEAPANAPNIIKAEFFIDTDPGFGQGTPITITPGIQVLNQNFSTSIAPLATGVHQLFVRVQNANGVWSVSNRTFFYKYPGPPANATDLTKAEYFFDTDPGFGQGTPITITPGIQILNQNFSTSIAPLATGVHQLFVRVQNANGVWSITDRTFFYKYPGPPATPANLTKAEYFFDTDPGFGQGKPITIAPGAYITGQYFYAGIDSLNAGTHQFFLRVQNGNGSWSITNRSSINITGSNICPNGQRIFSSPLSGTIYQWQVNTGSGFEDISNNINYSGATTANLQLSNIPSSFYGYEYRCFVDGQYYSASFILKIATTWTGWASNAWENPANWSCNIVPDVNTDVIFNSGVIVVNSNAVCRSVDAKPGTSLTINPTYTLTISGQ